MNPFRRYNPDLFPPGGGPEIKPAPPKEGAVREEEKLFITHLLIIRYNGRIKRFLKIIKFF